MMTVEIIGRVHPLTRTRALLLGAGLVAVGTSLGCQRPAPPAVHCGTQDVFVSAAPYVAMHPEAEQEMSWLHHAQICDLGPYLVATSTERDASPVFVLHKGTPSRPIFMMNGNKATEMMFDTPSRGRAVMSVDGNVALLAQDFKRVLASDGHSNSGQDVFSYAAYDSSRPAWIEYMDFGRDGTFDVRDTEVPGQPKKREVTIADRWVETVRRDGKVGVILDGQFMSVQDARARAANSTNRGSHASGR